METITNAASAATAAASKVIWGEPEKSETTTKPMTEPTTEETTEHSTGQSTEHSTEHNTESNIEERAEDKAVDNSSSTTKTTSDPTTDIKSSTTATDDTTGTQGKSDSHPNEHHQGGATPQNPPSSGESDAIRETKEEAEQAAKIVPKGPGPKPLSEVRSGAGAGHAAHDRTGSSAATGEGGINEPTHGEGSGEKWIKSSGMKADGGDFDAAAAGAGKEADRK